MRLDIRQIAITLAVLAALSVFAILFACPHDIGPRCENEAGFHHGNSAWNAALASVVVAACSLFIAPLARTASSVTAACTPPPAVSPARLRI